jgi:hypothetical protein
MRKSRSVNWRASARSCSRSPQGPRYQLYSINFAAWCGGSLLPCCARYCYWIVQGRICVMELHRAFRSNSADRPTVWKSGRMRDPVGTARFSIADHRCGYRQRSALAGRTRARPAAWFAGMLVHPDPGDRSSRVRDFAVYCRVPCTPASEDIALIAPRDRHRSHRHRAQRSGGAHTGNSRTTMS